MDGDAGTGQPATGAAAGRGVPLDDQLGFRLGRAHRRVRWAWEEVLAPLGVTAPQAAVVRALDELGAPGLRALARRLHSDPMNVRRLVGHLEQAGLVASVADPAHRQRRAVRLTRSGSALAGAVAEAAVAFDARLAGRVGPGELARLLDLLDRLEAALEPGEPAGTGR